jgi:hypothetical protein
MTLESNLIFNDFWATNVEIDIRELAPKHCLLYIYNTPYPEEETITKLFNAANHIEHKSIRYFPMEKCYIVDCSLS